MSSHGTSAARLAPNAEMKDFVAAYSTCAIVADLIVGMQGTQHMRIYCCKKHWPHKTILEPARTSVLLIRLCPRSSLTVNGDTIAAAAEEVYTKQPRSPFAFCM